MTLAGFGRFKPSNCIYIIILTRSKQDAKAQGLDVGDLFLFHQAESAECAWALDSSLFTVRRLLMSALSDKSIYSCMGILDGLQASGFQYAL